MPSRMRQRFFSKPVLIVLLVFLAYILFGFFALPAIVKWQIEKQVPEKLGVQVSVGDVRFNPLRFEFEISNLALSAADGSPLAGFRRLGLDFELSSVINRAWTFAYVTLDGPAVNLVIDKEGRHNFSALLEKLSSPEEKDPPPDSGMPRFIVNTLALSNGRIEVSDQWLDEPLLTHIEPLAFSIDNLNSLPDQVAHYRFSAPTQLGETLQTSGDLTLAPFSVNGQLAIADVKVETLARSAARQLVIAEPAGKIGVAAHFDLALDAAGELSGSVSEAGFDIAGLSLSAPGAAANPGNNAPLLTVDTLALKQGRVDLGAREVRFGGFELSKGRVTAALDSEGALNWLRLIRAPVASDEKSTDEKPADEKPADEKSAPSESETASAPPESTAGSAPESKPWSISIAASDVSQVAFTFSDPSRDLSLSLGSIALEMAPSAEAGAHGTRVALDKPKITLGDVRLTSAGNNVHFDGVTVSGDQLALEAGGQGKDAGRIALSKLQIALTGIAADQAGNQVTLREASLATGAIAFNPGRDAQFDDVTLQLNAVEASLREIAGAATLGTGLAAATAGAKSVHLKLADGSPDVRGEGLSATFSDAFVREPGGNGDMLQLGRVELGGGVLALREQTLSADTLVLADGKLRTWLDAQGRFNGLGPAANDAPKPGQRNTPALSSKTAAPTSAPESTAGPAWKLALKSTQLDNFSLAFEDRRRKPLFAVGLEAVSARVGNFASGKAPPMPVEVKAKLSSGGEIQAKGSVRADNGQTDLTLKLAGVALAPVQTYLSEFARLQLASGALSAGGRLRYGQPGGALLAYKGTIAVNQLLLEETGSKRPFVSWDAVATDDMVLSVAPNRLDIGELRVTKPAGRLIIAEDQSINLTDVLIKPAADSDKPDTAKPAAAEGEAATSDPFPATIARVRVADGLLEFADLSLRPQFGARMHELKGVITGLGSNPQQAAQIELDARVDEFGSAKIRGQINVMQPKTLTEIDMAFRNLEMTSLSPYVVKFAGYRIAAGKLSLDLQYGVKESKLQGQNKVVLNQVELGEKVDSPGALDLPLGLAIAILKDSNGVIDIGLPVSGDLANPEFDYGSVIGKAIGNLIVSIVTAPFRALGALFGAGDEEIDNIAFEPGSAAIAPPERHKLVTVARALKERPALKLVVPPTYAAEQDTLALKVLAVRSDVVRRMGVELKPGEAPGPIDSANPRVQEAIEAVFSERYAPAVTAAIKQRALEAAASDGSKSATAGDAGKDKARDAGKLPLAFYQSLVDRLISEHEVPEQALAELASERSEAIIAELAQAGEVPGERIAVGKLNDSGAVEDKAINLKLQLEAAK